MRLSNHFAICEGQAAMPNLCEEFLGAIVYFWGVDGENIRPG